MQISNRDLKEINILIELVNRVEGACMEVNRIANLGHIFLLNNELEPLVWYDMSCK